MLSLLELERAADAIETRLRGPDGEGHRIERVVEPDATSVALSFYGRDREGGEGSKRHLLLSCHPELGRVCEIASLPKAPDALPRLCGWLRAHLARARFAGACLRAGDRLLSLRFEAREGPFELLLALTGRRSNLYVLDATGVVLLAQRPLEKTRSDLSIGALWRDPPSPRDGRRVGEDRFREVETSALLRAVGELYGSRATEKRGQELATAIASALRKERKSAEKRLARLQADLAEADQAGEIQRHGELLKGHLSELKPGMSEIRVRDYETDKQLTIPLDPAKSPRDNLEATFKRYQKLVRRLTKAGGQLEMAQRRVEEIAGYEAELEAGEDLEALASRPALRKLLGRLAAKSPDRAPPPDPDARLPALLRAIPQRLRPRRYRSRDGLEIWVGRSDEGNDYLTTRLARGNDLFFHLDGAPGSHVILRTEGRPDPPSESVLDACELAVQFSKHKKAARADVHIVPIKQVKKPKGAKRGLVYVTGGRSLHLRREEKRLERLLADRIDD